MIQRIAVDLTTILLKLDIDPKCLELLETEKQRIEDRRADLVARVHDTKTCNTYLLHIEVQNSNDTQTKPHNHTVLSDLWPLDVFKVYSVWWVKRSSPSAASSRRKTKKAAYA